MSACEATIHHGPGHQSRTNCHREGAHEVHEAAYGSYSQLVRWRGSKVFSGCFDEPPSDFPDLDVQPPPAPLVAYEVLPCMFFADQFSTGEADTEDVPLAPGAAPGREPAYLHREAVVAWLRHIAEAPDPAAVARVALEALVGPGGEK